MKVESIVIFFLSTKDSIVFELTLVFPAIVIFLICENELVVNIKKNIIKNIIKLIIYFKNYMLYKYHLYVEFY